MSLSTTSRYFEHFQGWLFPAGLEKSQALLAAASWLFCVCKCLYCVPWDWSAHWTYNLAPGLAPSCPLPSREQTQQEGEDHHWKLECFLLTATGEHPASAPSQTSLLCNPLFRQVQTLCIQIFWLHTLCTTCRNLKGVTWSRVSYKTLRVFRLDQICKAISLTFNYINYITFNYIKNQYISHLLSSLLWK